MRVGIIGAGDKRHLQQLLFPFSFVGNGGNILTRWQEDNKNLERRKRKFMKMRTYLIFVIILHNRNLRPRNFTLESA